MEQEKLLQILTGLRRSILWIITALVAATIGAYFLSGRILAALQNHLHQELAFFSVAEPFMALIKLSFAISIFALVPFIMVMLWRAVATPFGLTRKTGLVFVLTGMLLFYAGAAFCYFVTLPFGVQFLLGYQTAHVKAAISLDRFLTFCFVFILAFGAMFELPLGMVFCARIGLCGASFFQRYRRYAILMVTIVAAIATPTPDVFNMMLMAVPLYALYELGIVALRIMGD
ncbi:MAG TPA: preprotein translocase subunit TatC [Proteobacteria bacterium]|nr:preprotein translocase subunit TatC [Pseudomonadota bacterium]